MTSPPRNRLSALAQAESLLVALDFDGVLSPLQDDPDASRPLPRSAVALKRLAALPETSCALVSGRDLATLRRVAQPPTGALLVGSHGAQLDLPVTAPNDGGAPEAGPTPDEALVLEQLDRLRDELREQSDAAWWVEVKPLSRVFHYRALSAEQVAWLHSRLDAGAADLPVRRVDGHDIVEFSVRHATKGTGLAAVLAALQPRAALYMGDDTTDEDAFAELGRGGSSPHAPLSTAVTVKVGPGETRAAYRLGDPWEVAEFLTSLADAREARVGPPTGPTTGPTTGPLPRIES